MALKPVNSGVAICNLAKQTRSCVLFLAALFLTHTLWLSTGSPFRRFRSTRTRNDRRLLRWSGNGVVGRFGCRWREMLLRRIFTPSGLLLFHFHILCVFCLIVQLTPCVRWCACWKDCILSSLTCWLLRRARPENMWCKGGRYLASKPMWNTSLGFNRCLWRRQHHIVLT
jgi:hypothetical protein